MLKRRIVWVTVLAWTMALLAGMANACLLQPHESGTSAAAVASLGSSAERVTKAAQAPHAEHGHHAGQAEPDDPSPDAGKTGCLKFCDDQRSTVAKGGAVQPDLPGPALFDWVEWFAWVPTDAAPTWWSAQRPRSQGPPLVVRFLRLTI
jgi:hypothetical protein